MYTGAKMIMLYNYFITTWPMLMFSSISLPVCVKISAPAAVLYSIPQFGCNTKSLYLIFVYK